MKLHKENTARYPTLLEAMGRTKNTPKISDEEFFGSFEGNPIILAQKYSHIIQNLILFEKESGGKSSIDELIEVFKKAVRRIVPYKAADIFFFTDSKGELKPVSSSFNSELYETVNHYYKEGILSVVFDQRKPALIPDLQNYTEKGSDYNYLFFPIYVDGAEKGVFAVKSTVVRENYSSIDENIVTILLNVAITKLEKLITRDKLNKAYEELQVYQGKLSNDFRLAAIGELTEGILEEISSPLQVIVSLVDLLEVEDTNAVEIGKIKTQVNKIDKVVKRLVRFTNLNHRNVTLMPININDAIREYYSLVESTLRSANIECVLDLSDNLPSILSHPTYIHQILTNLFGLVKKERHKTNGIIIQTRMKGDDIILRFITSVKITEKLTDKNLNYRIVKNLVKKHEGDSSLEDTLDSGSVIVLRFPLIRKIRG